MNVLVKILGTIDILAALAMIGLILIQHGKGADMGAAFGSGSAGSLFGASGSANFLSRMTAVLAAVFFGCTLILAYLSHSARPAGGDSLLERAVVGTPAAPTTAPAPPPASQIPGETTAPAAAPAPSAPATTGTPASGAPQIPKN